MSRDCSSPGRPPLDPKAVPSGQKGQVTKRDSASKSCAFWLWIFGSMGHFWNLGCWVAGMCMTRSERQPRERRKGPGYFDHRRRRASRRVHRRLHSCFSGQLQQIQLVSRDPRPTYDQLLPFQLKPNHQRPTFTAKKVESSLARQTNITRLVAKRVALNFPSRTNEKACTHRTFSHHVHSPDHHSLDASSFERYNDDDDVQDGRHRVCTSIQDDDRCRRHRRQGVNLYVSRRGSDRPPRRSIPRPSACPSLAIVFSCWCFARRCHGQQHPTSS